MVSQQLAAHREQVAHLNRRRIRSSLCSCSNNNPMVEQKLSAPRRSAIKISERRWAVRDLPLATPFRGTGRGRKGLCSAIFHALKLQGLARAAGPYQGQTGTAVFRQGVLHLRQIPALRLTAGEISNGGMRSSSLFPRQSKCVGIVSHRKHQFRCCIDTTVPASNFPDQDLPSLSRTNSRPRSASELCGKEDQWKVNYHVSRAGTTLHVSLWTGKALTHGSATTSKSYNTLSDFPFEFKTFTELKYQLPSFIDGV